MSDTNVTFESVEPPGGFSDANDALQCEVCGDSLTYSGRGKRPRYCELHNTPAKRNGATAATGSGGTGKGKGRHSKGRKATEAEWNRFLGMVLISGTYLIGRFAAGGHGILLDPPVGVSEDELDAFAIELAMEPDEATPIANLLAKRATPSELNKRVGKYIVSTLEYQEVGAALMAYSRRVGPVLAYRIRNNAREPRPVRQPRHARQTQTYNEGNSSNGQTERSTTPDNATFLAEQLDRRRRAGIYLKEPPIN